MKLTRTYLVEEQVKTGVCCFLVMIRATADLPAYEQEITYPFLRTC
jgi:hypothetical protein